MSNIKITLEYDGTAYSGWQIQKNTEQTIQQVLENCLTRINKSKVRVTGSGRTDAGVHALGQTANFNLDVTIPIERIPHAINSMLPADIICKAAEEVPADFHARFDASGKKYRYRILNRDYSSVFVRNYVYNLRQPLNITRIRETINTFKGEHDFAAFQSAGGGITDTVRNIKNIDFRQCGAEHWLEITGDGFLYNMVRIITGTLIEVGLGKKDPESVRAIIDSRDRKNAGFTAPARGLTLVKVFY